MDRPWDLTDAFENRQDFRCLVEQIARASRIPADQRKKRLFRKARRARIAQAARSHMGAVLRHAKTSDSALVAKTIRSMTEKQKANTR
jgi:hypothetical protein